LMPTAMGTRSSARANRRPRRVGTFAAAVCLVGSQVVIQAATSAPAAAAVPGRIVSMEYSALDSVGYKGVAVSCPPGKRVLGGGAQIWGWDPKKVFLTELRPTDDGTRFEVAAAEVAPGWDGEWEVAGYAICAEPLNGYTIVTGDSGPAAATYKTTFTQKCPTHMKVFGTGGEVVAPNGQAGLTLVRPDSALTIGRAAARAAPGGFWDQWSVRSYAICADPVPDQQYVDYLGNASHTTALCPADSTATGLGGGGGLVDLVLKQARLGRVGCGGVESGRMISTRGFAVASRRLRRVAGSGVVSVLMTFRVADFDSCHGVLPSRVHDGDLVTRPLLSQPKPEAVRPKRMRSVVPRR